MNGAIILVLAVALTATQSDSLPAPLRAAVGPWRLSEVGGKVGCTVNLSDQASGGGHALRAPPACHLAFPPLKSLSVWSLDARGAPVFSDPGRQHILTFNGPAGGPFQAIASDGKAWRLEPAAHPVPAASTPPAPPAPPADPAEVSGAGRGAP